MTLVGGAQEEEEVALEDLQDHHMITNEFTWLMLINSLGFPSGGRGSPGGGGGRPIG